MNASANRSVRKETIWRERVARQSASGKTIADYCRQEGIGNSTLSAWRKRLGVVGAAAQKPAAVAAPFLDLGPVKGAKPWAHPASLTGNPPDESPASIELRLELGGGVVLRIARH